MNEEERRQDPARVRAAQRHAERVEARLDEALEETFPASDPVSIDVRPWSSERERGSIQTHRSPLASADGRLD